MFPGPLGSSSDSLDQGNRTVVGRYQRGFGANSTIGGLVTSRSGEGYHNRVAGFDGRYRMNDRQSLRFQYLRSETSYPDSVVAEFGQPAGTFAGAAAQLGYEFGTREWFAFANYRAFDPEFRADSGFVSQVDFEHRAAGFGRLLRQPCAKRHARSAHEDGPHVLPQGELRLGALSAFGDRDCRRRAYTHSKSSAPTGRQKLDQPNSRQ